jgi:hypothetical protein
MADEPVPVPYPNTTATTTGPLTADRQPPHSQTTHPSTTATDPSPEVPHASDRDTDNVK